MIFSDHNAMRQEVNNKKNCKTHKHVEAKQYATTNYQWITEEIKEEIKQYLEKKWKRNHNDPKPLTRRKSNSKIEVYNNKSLYQETRKSSNKQFKFTPKATRKKNNKVQN